MWNKVESIWHMTVLMSEVSKGCCLGRGILRMSYLNIVNMWKQCVSDIIAYWYDCKSIALVSALGLVIIRGLILTISKICTNNKEWKTSSYYRQQLFEFFIVFFDGIYAVYLLYVTLGMRYIGQRQEVNLIPFQVSYGEMRFVIENVLLFIPFGFLMPLTSKKLSKYKRVFGSTLIISVCIEACQYIFRCGKTEVDDVILNAAGASAGFLLYKIMKMIKKRNSE